MSTYAVFGMTRAKAYVDAKRKTRNVVNGGRIDETLWLEKVHAAADEIMAGSSVVQLSEMYDAPHFAFAFLDLAKSQQEARSLHVRARIREIVNRKWVTRWVDVDRPQAA